MAAIGTYTPITAIALAVAHRNHTIQYTVHGACPVVHGMLSELRLQESLLSLGLFNSSSPVCTVIEYGAPAPPPAAPPPPSVPPATVRVDAYVTLNLNPEGTLPTTAAAVFASSALGWATERVVHAEDLTDHHAGGAALTEVELTEVSSSVTSIVVDDSRQMAGLLPELNVAAEVAMCAYPSEVRTCTVAAELPSPPSQPPPLLPPHPPPLPLAPPMLPAPASPTASPIVAAAAASLGRRLQGAVTSDPPSPPALPPQLPAPPLTPVLYPMVVTIIADRTYTVNSAHSNATGAPTALVEELAVLAARSATGCETTAVSCPLASVRNITLESSMLTELYGSVHLSLVADSKDVADAVAADLFETLVDTTGLVASLEEQLGLNVSLSISTLRAQFDHPDRGLVILEGSLPPPPPSPPPNDPGAVEAITTAVTTVVIGAVVGSVGMAAGGAAAGGAAGGAGGGGASGGGAVPLIFGVQRFGASAGLAANKSELQTGVAGGMSWATGSFSLVGGGSPPPPEAELEDTEEGSGESPELQRRRLMAWLSRRMLARARGSDNDDEEGARLINGTCGESIINTAWYAALEASPCLPQALIDLVDNLFTVFIALPAAIVIRLFGHWHWRRRMNKSYYALDLGDAFLKVSKGKQPAKRKFIPLPSFLVFPNLLNLVISVFITGLVEKSVALLTDQTADCTLLECKWPALLVLGACGLYMAVGFATTWHFYKRFLDDTWELMVPEELDAVDDPLYSLISKCRLRFCPMDRKSGDLRRFTLIDRVRGEFAAPEEDTEEPARTERLLKHPLRLFHAHAGDHIDAHGLLWLNRSSGSYGALGVFYEWILLSVQLCIATLAALGPIIEPGSPEAHQQMIATMILQYCTALYMLGCRPSSDRIDNGLVTTQFWLEGTQTLLLFLQDSIPFEYHDELQMGGFYLALAAMFLPIFEKGYDFVIVQGAKLCCKKGGPMTPGECAVAFCSCILTIPSLVLQLAGVGVLPDSGLAETIMDEAAGIAGEVNDQINTAAVSDALGNVLFTFRQADAARLINGHYKKRYRERSGKAVEIQKVYRMHRSKSTLASLREASAKETAAATIQLAARRQRRKKKRAEGLRSSQSDWLDRNLQAAEDDDESSVGDNDFESVSSGELDADDSNAVYARRMVTFDPAPKEMNPDRARYNVFDRVSRARALKPPPAGWPPGSPGHRSSRTQPPPAGWPPGMTPPGAKTRDRVDTSGVASMRV